MKIIPIEDIREVMITGVHVALPNDLQGEENHYFFWSPAALTAIQC